MERLFVDTSAWFAFIDRGDVDHAAVAQVLRRTDVRFVSSTFVFDEIVTLCRMRLGHATALRAGSAIRDPRAADLVRVTAADEDAAWALFASRTDKKYSFTDCTSFVLMRRMNIATAVALDDDFGQEGFTTLP